MAILMADDKDDIDGQWHDWTACVQGQALLAELLAVRHDTPH